MSSTHVALIRGINVGRASRVAMADLRAALSDLGYEGVRTVLNSGNVLLDAPGEDTGSIAAAIERVLAGDLDVPASVIVLTVEAFERGRRRQPARRRGDRPLAPDVRVSRRSVGWGEARTPAQRGLGAGGPGDRKRRGLPLVSERRHREPARPGCRPRARQEHDGAQCADRRADRRVAGGGAGVSAVTRSAAGRVEEWARSVVATLDGDRSRE